MTAAQEVAASSLVDFAAELEEYVEQALHFALEDQVASGEADVVKLFKENSELHARLEHHESSRPCTSERESCSSELVAELVERAEEIKQAKEESESLSEQLSAQREAMREEAAWAFQAETVATGLREQMENMLFSEKEAAQRQCTDGTSVLGLRSELEELRRSAEDAVQEHAGFEEELSEQLSSETGAMRAEAEKARMAETSAQNCLEELESLRASRDDISRHLGPGGSSHVYLLSALEQIKRSAAQAAQRHARDSPSQGDAVREEAEQACRAEALVMELQGHVENLQCPEGTAELSDQLSSRQGPTREEAEKLRAAETVARNLQEEVESLRASRDAALMRLEAGGGSASAEHVPETPAVLVGPSWKQVGIVAEVTVIDGVASIGVGFKSMPPNPLIIKKVHAGSWAEEVGIQHGDAFLELNSQLISNMTEDDFKVIMQVRPLTIKVWRLSSRPHHKARSATKPAAKAKT